MEASIGHFGGANSSYVLVPDQRTAERETLVISAILVSFIILGLFLGIGGLIWKKRRDAKKIREINGGCAGPRDAWGA